jgi:hypothetical protein
MASTIWDTYGENSHVSQGHIDNWFADNIPLLIVADAIINQQPGYKFITNNCQNFANWLVEAIIPGSVCCPDTIETQLLRYLHPRSQSRSSSPLSVQSVSTRMSSISSATSHGDTLDSILEDHELSWTVLKGLVPARTRSDLAKWGNEAECYLFSVKIYPEGPDNTLGSIEHSEMVCYCVLFPRRLAFFLAQDYQSPMKSAMYALVGVLDVQRDISDIDLVADTTVEQGRFRRGRRQCIYYRLEFSAHFQGSALRSYSKRQVRLEPIRTMANFEDRTIECVHTLRTSKRFSPDRHSLGHCESFLFAPVTPFTQLH